MFHGSGEKLVFKTKHGIRMKKGNITDFVFTFSHIATILNEAQSWATNLIAFLLGAGRLLFLNNLPW